MRQKPVSMAMVASRWITLSYYCTIKIQDESPNCVHGNLVDVFYLGNRILVLQVETGLILPPKIFGNVWTTFWPYISTALDLCHESLGWQPMFLKFSMNSISKYEQNEMNTILNVVYPLCNCTDMAIWPAAKEWNPITLTIILNRHVLFPTLFSLSIRHHQ